MSPLQVHRRANRTRRIPRRIHQLLTTIRAAQKRIDLVEANEDMTPEVQQMFIKTLRNEAGVAHAQVRDLQDRGIELGINPQLLSA